MVTHSPVLVITQPSRPLFRYYYFYSLDWLGVKKKGSLSLAIAGEAFDSFSSVGCFVFCMMGRKEGRNEGGIALLMLARIRRKPKRRWCLVEISFMGNHSGSFPDGG